MLEKLQYGPYSPSRLETATCGYSFFRQYVDPERKKTRGHGSLPQERGSAVHEVFERITMRMCENEFSSFSENEIRQWVVEAIQKYPTAYTETAEIMEMAKLYLRCPPKMLVRDAKTELRLAVRWDPAAKDFVECDYDDEDAFGRGRADILMFSDDTTKAVVIDHKTQPNIEDADTFQMGFYAWVIWKTYPFLNEIQTILHFARYGKYSEPYVWSLDDLRKIEDEIVTRVMIIEGRQTWDAIPYKNCQYCPFIAQCPAFSEYIDVDEEGNYKVKSDNFKIISDTEKAVKVAGLINILEEVSKIAKKNLREYVKNTSPVAIPGKVFMFRANEEINWDKVNKGLREEVYKVFEKHGVDPKVFMSFNQTTTKNVWVTGNEALVKDLSDLLPRKVTAEFSGYKA